MVLPYQTTIHCAVNMEEYPTSSLWIEDFPAALFLEVNFHTLAALVEALLQFWSYAFSQGAAPGTVFYDIPANKPTNGFPRSCDREKENHTENLADESQESQEDSVEVIFYVVEKLFHGGTPSASVVNYITVKKSGESQKVLQNCT